MITYETIMTVVIHMKALNSCLYLKQTVDFCIVKILLYILCVDTAHFGQVLKVKFEKEKRFFYAMQFVFIHIYLIHVDKMIIKNGPGLFLCNCVAALIIVQVVN